MTVRDFCCVYIAPRQVWWNIQPIPDLGQLSLWIFRTWFTYHIFFSFLSISSPFLSVFLSFICLFLFSYLLGFIFICFDFVSCLNFIVVLSFVSPSFWVSHFAPYLSPPSLHPSLPPSFPLSLPPSLPPSSFPPSFQSPLRNPSLQSPLRWLSVCLSGWLSAELPTPPDSAEDFLIFRENKPISTQIWQPSWFWKYFVQ